MYFTVVPTRPKRELITGCREGEDVLVCAALLLFLLFLSHAGPKPDVRRLIGVGFIKWGNYCCEIASA